MSSLAHRDAHADLLGGPVFPPAIPPHPRPVLYAGAPGSTLRQRRPAPSPAGQRTCRPDCGAVGTSPGGAAPGAPGRAGRWDARRARDPALVRGRSEAGRGGQRRAGAGRLWPAGGGRVLGAPRAVKAGAALGPPSLGARDELHPEKGLLQAGRQQDQLGAAQDLRVPDAHRQRGLWRRVVRPPGLRAAGRVRGARGASGRTEGGRAGSRPQVELLDEPGGSVHPFPGPPRGSPPLLGARGRAPTP